VVGSVSDLQMRYFATAIQGIGPILRDELTGADGVTLTYETEFDGRNDLVPFEARSFDPNQIRTCEDVYASVNEVASKHDARKLSSELCTSNLLERSLSVYAAQARPLKTRMTFRVVARVLSEEQFMRTELRDAMVATISQARPRWTHADPAELEFWVLETKPGFFRLGLRLTGAEMRHRGGRAVERQGATKPTLAAAMVLVAGKPATLPLLDATCGTGTILREGLVAGWDVVGSDIDAAAVDAATTNAQGAHLLSADARRLPFGPSSFGAITCNLPFGKQYRVPGAFGEWVHEVLEELLRVSVAGAPIVLLIPSTESFMKALARVPALQLIRNYNLRLLGEPTALWVLRHV